LAGELLFAGVTHFIFLFGFAVLVRLVLVIQVFDLPSAQQKENAMRIRALAVLENVEHRK
jgi:uncharacterized protein (UPF0212 family)